MALALDPFGLGKKGYLQTAAQQACGLGFAWVFKREGNMESVSLERFLDISIIQDTKAKYCLASDTDASESDKATKVLEAILHPSFAADYTAVQFSTKSDFIAFITQNVAPSADWVWHAIGTPHVEVEGDIATGSWAVIVRIKRKDADQPIEMIGRYTDRFVRVPEGWQIQHIHWRPLS
ncbi:MAG TPA: nuclear transport factor 2 family protein [Sphingobium sp.]|uniref:nuclear transport factor 2 family protein n=1 Tax=Sphingobium sp. TaxID=1912891 RepID=UPI002ED57A17